MTEAGDDWALLLTESAQSDFRQIIAWTADRFGEGQARSYAETLSQALEALTDGPDVPGAKARDEIQAGLRSLHVAGHGRKGRHFVLFRVTDDRRRRIEILRILHDAMDVSRHLPESSKEEGSSK